MGGSTGFKSVKFSEAQGTNDLGLADVRCRWVGDLAQIYASQGLINMSFERFEMAPEYLRYDTDKVFTSYEEFSRTILDPKGGNEGERLRGLVEKAYSECQKGVAITADMVVAVARKPQTSEVTLGNQN